jgi:hypothetical protein
MFHDKSASTGAAEKKDSKSINKKRKLTAAYTRILLPNSPKAQVCIKLAQLPFKLEMVKIKKKLKEVTLSWVF